MKLGLLAALGLALALPLSVAAATHHGAARTGTASISFGRRGGNIAPYRVTIARTGAVTATGAVRRAGLVPSVSTDAVGGLVALARAEGFAAMPGQTYCRGSNPDFSSSFVTVTTTTGSRTVAVRGSCRAGFTQLLAVIQAVAGLRS